ncbi:Transcriptional regulator, AraC family [Pseudomonas cichorii]|nr:Transcriptional regulator, AraC family [Pseudomonas cichorii]
MKNVFAGSNYFLPVHALASSECRVPILKTCIKPPFLQRGPTGLGTVFCVWHSFEENSNQKPAMPTLAASCAQVILRLASSISTPSQSLQSLYSEVEMSVQDGSRVEIAKAVRLIEMITSESGDPETGLQAYGLFQPGQLNSQLYAIMSSSTLGEALRTAEQYSILLTDGTPLSITEEKGTITLNFLRLESLNVTRQYIDCCLSTFVGLTHWLLPWSKPVPVAATFSYMKPECCEALESVFGSNLTFSSDINRISYSLKDCARPLSTANPSLKIHHVNHTNEELSLRQYRISPVVKNHIFVSLSAGSPISLAQVALKLNLSTRTLQNRLDDESTGFLNLLDECRRELANQFLCFTDYTVMSIAEKLSFRDGSSFHKACNRWFGCPPGLYRNKSIGKEIH